MAIANSYKIEIQGMLEQQSFIKILPTYVDTLCIPIDLMHILLRKME